MDAITLLKRDHADVEKLFKQFEKAGERAYKSKRSLVDRMVEALSVHAAIEEQIFYPVVREVVPDTESITLESLEEHHIVKWVLSELDGMDPEAERFDAKVTVLIENVRHHVEEEEEELFPKVRDRLGRSELADLGAALEKARRVAPTHPHPRAPDTPPGNLVAGAAASAVDHVGDAVRGIAEGGAAAASDLVATVTGRERAPSSTTGSSTARRAASRTRDNLDSAASALVDKFTSAGDQVEEAGRTAKATTKAAARGTKRTATTARAGAKSVGRSTRRAAGDVQRTAKRAAKTTARTASRSTKRSATTRPATKRPATKRPATKRPATKRAAAAAR